MDKIYLYSNKHNHMNLGKKEYHVNEFEQLIAGSILLKLHDGYNKVFLKCSSLSPIQKII